MQNDGDAPVSGAGVGTAPAAAVPEHLAPVAERVAPLLEAFFPAGAPLRFTFWDDSSTGPEVEAGSVRVCSPDALRRLVWAPGELGLGRAYVAGELEIEGDVIAVLGLLEHAAQIRPDLRSTPSAVSAIRSVGGLGLPIAPPREEAHPRGRLHSPGRDAAAISHHYDVGNDFYRLVLGPSMTYSCARFVDDTTSLEDAQAAKFELVCRKLGLHERPGATLLDVGCGWGSLAMHAAEHHGARVVGVSISHEQVVAARERVAAAGLSDLVEIREQDYRDLSGERFDAISSIGMFEHVGARRIPQYFETLRDLLGEEGRLLNHAISSVGGSKIGRRSFVGRYVFPDGELIDVGQVVLAMEASGFEVRDVESLREHYERTLRAWVANLEADWDRAVELVGPARARVWRLYMAGSANGFHDGGIGVHQVLGVVPDAHGTSGMPLTRADFV
ncbi:MAG: cyclopropane-fatty-acyl-phospholipid synthase family protein [Actinomycetota bacterium]|nr:cyclopropane-fatty-acyl-phospholipid synthase family protein [Actinomycetota bacterium]